MLHKLLHVYLLQDVEGPSLAGSSLSLAFAAAGTRGAHRGAPMGAPSNLEQIEMDPGAAPAAQLKSIIRTYTAPASSDAVPTLRGECSGPFG